MGQKILFSITINFNLEQVDKAFSNTEVKINQFIDIICYQKGKYRKYRYESTRLL